MALLEQIVLASASTSTYTIVKSLSLTLPPVPLRPFVHVPLALHDMIVFAISVMSPF